MLTIGDSEGGGAWLKHKFFLNLGEKLQYKLALLYLEVVKVFIFASSFPKHSTLGDAKSSVGSGSALVSSSCLCYILLTIYSETSYYMSNSYKVLKVGLIVGS